YQYMFNVLQLNNGNGTFSEIGQLSGVSNTDWSWTTLFADFDNDADKDLLVTNGLVRDIKNKDYIISRKALMDSLKNVALAAGKKPSINSMELIDMAPSIKLNNYIYANNDDLTFTDKGRDWGFMDNTWTHGAAYADLDNDGDLDIVMNNMNEVAFVYRNKTVERGNKNYLRVQLIGDHGSNRYSYGAKVWIYQGEELQVQEVSPVRGYFSSSEPILHFGLGDNALIDRLLVQWPDGRRMEMESVKGGQLLQLRQADAKTGALVALDYGPKLFEDRTLSAGIDFVHQENNYDDYKEEILLPHRMSHLGPCMATADVDGNGLEDFYIGGAAGQAGVLYLQQSGGTFQAADSKPWGSDQKSEDINALFFDADGDSDMDLYVVSGGNEFAEGSAALRDRLYLNNGKGQFSKSNGLPNIKVSGGVVSAGDMDGDGDQDLFVGGRQTPGKYGHIARSYVLQNNKGRFTDVTTEIAPDLERPGMVTDAQWLDIDQDQDQDLIVTGEWMPIGVYLNEGGKLKTATKEVGLEKTNGWWNRIAVTDMDGDGDQDLIVGNLGLNIKYKASEEEPFKVYIKDFDGNGTNDVYLGYYDTDGVCYPVRGRECSSQQLPFVKKEFKTYDAFANASIDKVLGARSEGAIYHEAQVFETVYIENLGNKQFKVHKLPNEAQISPTYGIICRDWNGDGHMDVLLAGNYYEREVETTRSDAGIGQVLLGNGKGEFKALHPSETGIIAYLDVRALAMVEDAQQNAIVLIANNNNGMQVYRQQRLVN
ncbi:MAG: VCBS repeat-containing protein, partial [Bacteroidota bacterium]